MTYDEGHANVSSELLQQRSQVAADFLKSIASPHRLALLCQLIGGEKSVSQLVELTGVSQSSVSQHLGRLKDMGIVAARRDHRLVYYTLDDAAVIEIMAVLYRHFCQNTNI